ncbi:uncharacterized protein BX664DRAFT_369650 [Halteromyces radiatus]|uniref:uncharacterized protein n=1 Tax=Halteromyces radiatus TaxID=101107 RepID=UPI0022201C17|nr:uncharacterized protein BX664DRAFT_369650 [Halteromyces radiatus]KAI8076880.1 hypothetical protein BX664DRAFT_369650 [Halteromyces radiatus]
MSREKKTVAIIGSGFSGLCAAIRVKQELGIRATVFELSDNVGGTWHVNTYPGCACDIPVHLYSFSFELNSEWSQKYSPQAEIHEYLVRVVDKYRLRSQIKLNTEVISATWCEDLLQWKVEYRHKEDPPETKYFDIVFAGLGSLRIPKIPKQFTKFEGPTVHSAKWDPTIDYSNKRIGIVGTGASAIQLTPELQKIATNLVVFQRTPPWIFPKAQFNYSKLVQFIFRYFPFIMRLYRWYLFLGHEWFYYGFRDNNGILAKLGLRYFRRITAETLTKAGRPDLIPIMTPNYAPGCKRIVRSDDYLQTMAKSNVNVVTSPIGNIQGNTIYTKDGQAYELDILVLATGFEIGKFGGNIKLYGRNNMDLTSYWRNHPPRTFKSTLVNDFPNMFILFGPGTGLGHNSAIGIIESQVEYGIKMIKYMMDHRLDAMDPTRSAQKVYSTRLVASFKDSVWQSGCRSFYKSIDGNIYSLWSGTVMSFWRELKNTGFDTSFNYYRKALPPVEYSGEIGKTKL